MRKVKIGTRVESINFGWMESLTAPYDDCWRKDVRGGKVDVRFDNTGAVRKGVLVTNFLAGGVRDGSVVIELKPGDVYNSSNDGKFEIFKLENNRKILVKFLDTGNICAAQKDNALTGIIGDRVKRQASTAAVRAERKARSEEHRKHLQQAAEEKAALARAAGEKRRHLEHKRAEAAAAKVARAMNAEKAAADLAKSCATILTPQSIDTDLSKPTNDLEIDFKDRDGLWVLRYSRTQGGEKSFVQTRLGRLHNNMTQRGRVGGSLQNISPGYRDVTVSDEFKDPQKFCDWAVQQPGWGLGYSLDKDLLKPGNRVYCAECCCFLPQKINTALIVRGGRGARTCLISKHKGKYRVMCWADNKKILVGMFPCEGSAMKAYVEFRKAYVARLAQEFSATISKGAFDALMCWQPS